MLKSFSYALVSTIIVSFISLIGILTLAVKKKRMPKIVTILVAFAAGALMGAVFFHLLPEAVHELEFEHLKAFELVFLGIFVFFLLETYLYWYHCHAGHIHKHAHKGVCRIKPMGWLNIFGDGLHNLVDGAIIASSYLASIPLGVISSIAVAAHEIPQEIGDFGVLVYSGFSIKKALFFNFLSALTAILGAVLTFYFAGFIKNLTVYMIPFAAGGFLYIAGTDLMSELKEEPEIKKATWQLVIFLIGVGVLWLATKIIPHAH